MYSVTVYTVNKRPDNNRVKLNQQTSGCCTPTAAGRPPTADRRPPPTSEVLRASSYTPRPSMARFARGLPTPGRAEARATLAGGPGFENDGDLSIDPACRCQLRSIQPFTFPRFGFVRALEPQMRHFSRSFRDSAFKKETSQNRL